MILYLLVMILIATAANRPGSSYTKGWTSGQSSGDISSFLWATGPVVTHNVDLSIVGTHLALDVDLQLHPYNGTSDRMGAFCEIGKSSTAMPTTQ